MTGGRGYVCLRPKETSMNTIVLVGVQLDLFCVIWIIGLNHTHLAFVYVLALYGKNLM